jgi:hypothetical protein
MVRFMRTGPTCDMPLSTINMSLAYHPHGLSYDVSNVQMFTRYPFQPFQLNTNNNYKEGVPCWNPLKQTIEGPRAGKIPLTDPIFS